MIKFRLLYYFVISIILINILSCKANTARNNEVKFEGYIFKHLPYYISTNDNSKYAIANDSLNANLVYDEYVSKYRLTVLQGYSANTSIVNRADEGKLEFSLQTSMPPISVSLCGNWSGQKIDINEFSECAGLVAEILNLDVETRFKVISFDIQFYLKGVFHSYESSGPYFNSTGKKLLDDSNQDMIVIFNNIVVDTEYEEVKVDPFVMHLLVN